MKCRCLIARSVAFLSPICQCSVCLSVYPSVCLAVCLAVCLSARLSACLSVYASVCLLVSLPVCLPVCRPVYLSLYRSVYVCVCLCACVCVCVCVCVRVCVRAYRTSVRTIRACTRKQPLSVESPVRERGVGWAGVHTSAPLSTALSGGRVRTPTDISRGRGRWLCVCVFSCVFVCFPRVVFAALLHACFGSQPSSCSLRV